METSVCSAVDAHLLESCAAEVEDLPAILAEDACRFCVRCAPLFKELAFKDHTGALNRRGVEREFMALQEAGVAFGAIYVDVDNMKTVNDKLGHETGDEVIRQTIAQLGQGKRENDALIIGRLGGDEFVLLLTEDNETSELEQERRGTALSTEGKMAAAAERHQEAFVAREAIKHINTLLAPYDKQVGLKVTFAPYPLGTEQPNLEEWLQTFDVKGPAAQSS